MGRVFSGRGIGIVHVLPSSSSPAHVVRHQRGDLAREVGLIDTEMVGHGVAHGVHGVMALVAMKRPVAGRRRREFDGAHLADGDVRR